MSKTRYGILFDLTKCVGCRSCQVACKVENDVPAGSYRTWVKEIERGEYPHARNVPVPIVCNQCDKPACTRVCPVQATYSLENGIVYIDPHRCIGCGYCMAACPYAMRFIHPVRKVAEKCDWCWPRIRDGLSQPACASACPSGVIVFGDLSDPESEIRRILDKKPSVVLKPETGNGPLAFYIGLDDRAVRHVDAEGEGE